MKKIILVVALTLASFSFFVVRANAYDSGSTIIGSYKVDTWENKVDAESTFLKFWDVSPSTDGNLSLGLIYNKNTIAGIKDLYFNFDYGEFYLTPFEYYTDYLNSGYQYAPFQSLGNGNMLKIDDNDLLRIIDKGDIVATFALQELHNYFIDYQYLYIIQLIDNVDYYTIFNQGHNAGYNKGYQDGYNNGSNDGYNNGYNSGYNSGYSDGSNNGYNNGYNSGYDSGYNDGALEESETSKMFYGKFYNGEWLTAEEYATIRVQQTINEIGNANDNKIGLIGFIPSILGSIGAFFFTLASFEVMGISLMDIIALFASLAVIILIIKLIKGGD